MRCRLWFAALAAAAVLYAVPILAQQCLHGTNEDATEKARRRAALGLLRNINTQEAAVFARTKGFAPLGELGVDPSTAAGFQVQFTTDGKSYSLIARDTKDGCHFMMATNQDGVIFQGYPIDFEVQPIKR